MFIDFLVSEKRSDNSLDWPNEKIDSLHYSPDENPITLIKLTTCEWEKTRRGYPNWIIVPEDQRNVLWNHTKVNIRLFYEPKKHDLQAPDDLNFLYEFNWRLEKCLSPIYNDFIPHYEEILNRYNPFPEMFHSADNQLDPSQDAHRHLPWQIIKSQWLELHVAILRYFREEGLLEKWNSVDQKLQTLFEFLPLELQARFNYEKCLNALFTLDLVQLRDKLQDWPVNPSLPMWEARRAGLLAEIGEADAAENILEQCLNGIRKQLNLSPVLNNYLLISQESYVMHLLQFVSNAISFEAGDYKSRRENRQRFSERWNYFKAFKCDPWNERKLFEIKLNRPVTVIKEETQKFEYDIGRVSTSISFGKSDEEAIVAYSFLRFCEEAGVPFIIHNTTYEKKTAQHALERVANYSPYWSYATLVRLGDEKVVDTVFDRKSIANMTTEQIDTLIQYYLSALEQVLPEIKRGGKNGFAWLLAASVPEALSRLCVKSSEVAKLQLLNLLREIYSSAHRHHFRGIANLTSRLISSFSSERQYELLPEYLKIPVLIDLDDFSKREFQDPFYSITANDFIKYEGLEITENVIEELIKLLNTDNSGRDTAAIRLGTLYKFDLLNKEQSASFAEGLWSKVDVHSQFPSGTSYFKFAFLDFPHPEGVIPEDLFKKYILGRDFPIQKNAHGTGISITHGEIDLCHEIIRGTKSHFTDFAGVEWSEDERFEILKKLVAWWDADKDYLRTGVDRGADLFGSIPDEFRSRFKHLVSIIAYVISPILAAKLNNDIRMSLTRLIKEMDEYGIACLQAKAACLQLFTDSRTNLYTEILQELSSRNNDKIIDGLLAAVELIYEKNKTKEDEELIANVLHLMSQLILWRREEGLVSVMNIMGMIVSKFPQYLDQRLLTAILKGLDYIRLESSPMNEDSRLDVSERLSQRQSAAKLACRLFRYYSNQGKDTPQPLLDWWAVCSDVNEFAEIRNQWILPQ